MPVFQFDFNPKLKEGLFFESDCHFAQNIYEKRLGDFYLLGSLKNALPSQENFLNNLIKFLKEKYYSLSRLSPEKALKESLKKANEFLDLIVKRGEVKWLGNLDFAVFVIKKNDLIFTKAGEIKIFLLRSGQVIDIEKKLKFEEIEPYPIKIFSTIVTTRLLSNDLILVLTKELSEVFLKEDLLNQLSQMDSFELKSFNNFLKNKREKFSQVSGVFFIIHHNGKSFSSKKEVILPKKISPVFLLPKILQLLFLKLEKFNLIFQAILKKLKFPSKLPLPSLNFLRLKNIFQSRQVALILTILLFLTLGAIIFNWQEKEKINQIENNLKEIQEKLETAKIKIVEKKEEEAKSLLNLSWQEISVLKKINTSLPQQLKNQISSVSEEIFTFLSDLTRLKEIENPKMIFQFEPKIFVPQKMINLHFYSPYAKNLFLLKENEILKTDLKFSSASQFSDSILFFSKPNKITILKEKEVIKTILLSLPDQNFDLENLFTFRDNLYFLEKKSKQILKYPYLTNFQWGEPEFWLEVEMENQPKSMAIDGSMWVLNDKNEIAKYYRGKFQGKLNLEVFPYPKNFSKIFTNPLLPYLYILEPEERRILILDKNGQIIKQLHSEKFDNLLDFSLSEDGKTIFILNGLKVYQVEI